MRENTDHISHRTEQGAEFKQARNALVKCYQTEFLDLPDKNAEALRFVQSYISPLMHAPSDAQWPHDFHKPETVVLFGRKIESERFSKKSIEEAPFIRSRPILFPATPRAFVDTMLAFLTHGNLPKKPESERGHAHQAHLREGAHTRSAHQEHPHAQERAFMQDIHRATNLLEIERIRTRVCTQYEGVEPGRLTMKGTALLNEINTSAEHIFKRYFAADMSARELGELRNYAIYFYDDKSMESFSRSKYNILLAVDKKAHDKFSESIHQATLSQCANLKKGILAFYGEIEEGTLKRTKDRLVSELRAHAYVEGIKNIPNARPEELVQMKDDVIEIFSGRMKGMLDKQGQHLHRMIEQYLLGDRAWL